MKKTIAIILLCFVYSNSYTKENVSVKKLKTEVQKIASGCTPTTAFIDMEINNVRAGIGVGGILWFNSSNLNAQYEIPKNSGKHSLYAGALWIGGTDANGNIVVAAQTYRQTGEDFWGGPIDPSNCDITPATCVAYDAIWKVTKQEVQDFINGQPATPGILNYPGNSPYSGSLAPYVDVNNNQTYDPTGGDYPAFDLTGNYTNGYNNYLHGDESNWWVFSDVGNAHAASQSTAALGVEIHAEAYAYTSNDYLNNTTFYQYKIINKCSNVYSNVYLGNWVDPDLGFAVDDYVGCDVGRNLGYCYNGDPFDEGSFGYGANPPVVGTCILQGPIAPANDGIDNDHDGTIDEVCEQVLMSSFMFYHNVNNQPNGNPDGPIHHYNYLKATWGDGLHCTYGNDGRNPANPICNYMFSDNTDPINFPLYGAWTEVTAGNAPEDRRYIQSAGPFDLLPGQVSYTTFAALWFRDTTGATNAISGLQLLVDSARIMFDNWCPYPAAVNELNVNIS